VPPPPPPPVATVRVSEALAFAFVESVTVTASLNVPAAGGVPESCPVELSATPPEVVPDQVYGPVPPLAVIVVL